MNIKQVNIHEKDFATENYWEVLPENNTNANANANVEPIKKKKVSFDDILNNMNLVVSNNGTLQLMTPVATSASASTCSSPSVSENTGSGGYSYIHNKYFKDYRNENRNLPVIRKPKTIEEYKQMIMEDNINRIREKRRIESIKSTKILLTNHPPISVSSNNGLNKLMFN